MEYFERKKRQGLIFTEHNIDPSKDYNCMQRNTMSPIPICEPPGYSYWSKLSGRYRTSEEQKEFAERGGIDVKLPPIDPELS